jgi:hypothetical protein
VQQNGRNDANSHAVPLGPKDRRPWNSPDLPIGIGIGIQNKARTVAAIEVISFKEMLAI